MRAAARPGYLWRRLDVFPDLVELHQANPRRYPYLLESAAAVGLRGLPPESARYDILFALPQERLVLHPSGALTLDGVVQEPADFLARFDQLWRATAQPSGVAHLPFTGGWFVYLGYELAQQIEPRLRLPGGAQPTAFAAHCPAAIVRDHRERKTYLVCEGDRPEALRWMEEDVAQGFAHDLPSVAIGSIEEDEPQRFLTGVKRVKDYIQAGDVFQVNLSRAWRIALKQAVAPAWVFRRLRLANPAPFAGLAMIDDHTAIVSSSPERLVAVRDGVVRTRPIAGTHPRGATDDDDRRLARELLAHPKERAEHIMLIDLERNDLGRVCRAGSVRVSELMALESYRYVHHIVSEIQGVPRDSTTPGEVLRALFPGGTITGCPKIRCMEIIAELEGAPREAYTGSMGYVNHDGSLDMNILIRTFVQQHERLTLRAGSGIVADSVPERELAETRAKARGLLAALEAT